MNIAAKLNDCNDFSCILEIVKNCVDKTLGKRRNGLMLGLTDLPLNVGAFHAVPSNLIMINKKLLNAIMQYDKKLVNAYLFHVLLHEYLHTLGFLNEKETGILVYIMSRDFLGEQHPSTLIARHGINCVFPRLEINSETDRRIIIVNDFDSKDLSYIG